MRIDEYEILDGLALADLLRKGATTPLALMQCAIELAQSRGERLNALTYPRYDESLEIARHWRPTGNFQGIPFLLKDSALASRRFPSSLGSRLFNDTSYSYDATLTKRFERLGFIPFARTTVPQLCMAPVTEAPSNGGPTYNPWDFSRSAGGSSGGAAAAVAAGIVPIAHGSDGGGSIRIPAACCGVYGLKPSRGRIPTGPLRGEMWAGLAGDGVLSRTVRDTAAALDGISGWEPGAPYAAPPQSGSYLQNLHTGLPRRLKIIVWRRAWCDIPIDGQCLDALEATAALCRGLGHEVRDAEPAALDYDAFVRAHIDVLATNVVLAVQARLNVLGRQLADDDLEPAILDAYRMGLGLNAAQYAQAIQQFHAVGQSMQRALSDADIILTPALTQLPAKLGELSMQAPFLEFRGKVARYATFLAVINASGQPAACLPLGRSAEGLPIATQLIGQFGREDLILGLSAELESASPWALRIPRL